MEFYTVTFLSFLILLIIYVYKKLTKNHNFFKLRGIECIQPRIFFGNMWESLIECEDFETVVKETYKKFRNEKLFGVFNFLRPVIIVKDVDLINQITIDHADKFKNRYHFTIDGILGKSLFLLRNNQADDMRNAIHSFFVDSTWREKHRENITACADDLIKYYYREVKETEEAIIDTKDDFEKFYSNVIAQIVLGVGRSCNYDRKSKVLEIAHEIENDLTSTSGSLKILAMNIFPWIRFRIFQPSIYAFLQDYVIDEIKKRRKRKMNRSDFLQSFVENKWNDDQLIAAQVMSFLTAGFSTTSTLFQACCFVLARNEKRRREIENSEFLEKFIYEVLRKWSPVSMTSRICSQDCTIVTKSEEIFKFFEGDLVEFPVRLIQNDHKNFNDPPAVNPNRTENLNLSFGFTTRACIGEKLAILLVKILLTKLNENFLILHSEQTPYEFNFCDKNSFAENVFVKIKLKDNL